MEFVLLIIQLILAILLIALVLVQRSDSDGFGLGSGGGSGLLSSRGQANLMTRMTAILAALFMINSLALGIIHARSTSSTLIDEVVEQDQLRVPVDGAVTPELNKEAPASTLPDSSAPAPDAATNAPDASSTPIQTPIETPKAQ